MEYALHTEIDKSYSMRVNFAAIFMISLFYLNENVRGIISDKLSTFNIIFLIFGGLLFAKKLLNKQVNMGIFFAVLIFSTEAFVNAVFLHQKSFEMLGMISNVFFTTIYFRY